MATHAATAPIPRESDRTLEKAAMGLVHVALILVCLVTLIPFFWILCGAFKSAGDFFTHTFLPTGDGFLGIAWNQLTMENFHGLFYELSFLRNIINSFFLASVISLFATLCAAMGGYALAKFHFPMRAFFTGLIFAALIVPGPLLLAPGFQLLYHLGMLNSFAGLILPAAAPAFGVFLFRQAMLNTVPQDILDAGRIDGCSESRLFFQVVLPLVRPMLGAFMMITFLGTWNNFIGPQVILQSPEKFPLSVAIAQLNGLYQTNYGMISAGTIMSVAPVMALFLLLQKEFISGLTSGAVKG